MDKLYFAKLRDTAKIPTKRDEDGCYDIYADFGEAAYVIPPHESVLIPTGICSAFDKKYRLAVRDRGSNTKSHLHTIAGQIDSGYRGEIFVALVNTSNMVVILDKEVVEVQQVDNTLMVPYTKAIGQLALEYVPMVEVEELPLKSLQSIPSERGAGKLGSSGK